MSRLAAISIVSPDAAQLVHDAVGAGLRAFNRVHAGDAHRIPLILAAAGPQGETVGGLIRETAWGWLFIDPYGLMRPSAAAGQAVS